MTLPYDVTRCLGNGPVGTYSTCPQRMSCARFRDASQYLVSTVWSLNEDYAKPCDFYIEHRMGARDRAAS
jgi:hypothetical protein